jgi:Na+/H+ antiporter NhaA
MTTTRTRKNRITAAIGAAIAGIAAPALLFLGAGTAHAIQDSVKVPRATVVAASIRSLIRRDSPTPRVNRR